MSSSMLLQLKEQREHERNQRKILRAEKDLTKSKNRLNKKLERNLVLHKLEVKLAEIRLKRLDNGGIGDALSVPVLKREKSELEQFVGDSYTLGPSQVLAVQTDFGGLANGAGKGGKKNVKTKSGKRNVKVQESTLILDFALSEYPTAGSVMPLVQLDAHNSGRFKQALITSLITRVQL